MEVAPKRSSDEFTRLSIDIGRTQSQALNEHTSYTITGKPFPLSELGPAPRPDEAERAATVQTIMANNSEVNPVIDSILNLLQRTMHMDSACVSLLTGSSTKMKHSVGTIPSGGEYHAPGVCHWTLQSERPQVMVVENMLEDARTCSRPVVVEAPYMRFYAACPLLCSNEKRLGTLCLWKTRPSRLNQAQAALLCNLAELVIRILEAGVLENEPENPLLGADRRRGTSFREQAYAFVDTSKPGWELVFETPAFIKVTQRAGQEATPSSVPGEGGPWTEGCGVNGCLPGEIGRQEDESADVGKPELKFWDEFRSTVSKAPWNDCREGLESGKQFAICKLVSKSTPGKTYNAIFRPATSESLDKDAKFVAIPTGETADSESSSDSEAEETEPRDVPAKAGYAALRHLYFVLLTPAQEAVKAPRPTPFPGLRLGPILGSGAYGRVMRALQGKRLVAAKIIHDLSEAWREEGLPVEASLLRGLQHPGIVQLLDYKMARTAAGAERLWLILEFCNKGTLSDAIDRGWFRVEHKPDSPPCMETLLTTAREVASGLAFLHSKDILHCDISGGNVLLHAPKQGSDGHGGGGLTFTAKVSDFGACRRADKQYPDRPVDGTYSWMAPEVIGGAPFSKAGDVYSFGVLLWELYCGQRAWDGLTGFQITYAVLWNGQSLQFPDDAPGPLRDLACACLSSQPEKRPTIDEVVDRLAGMAA